MRTLDFSRFGQFRSFLLKCLLIATFSVVFIAVVFYLQFFHFMPAYTYSYMKGFNYQNNALKNAGNKNKIVIIGGSYMTFATDPDIIQEKTGIPTYIFGVHSGMGMAPIIDLVKNYLQANDILVFSFRTYESDYYGADLIYS